MARGELKGDYICLHSYEEFIAYVFDRPFTKPVWHEQLLTEFDKWDYGEQLADAAAYIGRLLREPKTIMTQFTEQQFSMGLEYLARGDPLVDIVFPEQPGVDENTSLAIVAGIVGLFENVFDPALRGLARWQASNAARDGTLCGACVRWWIGPFVSGYESVPKHRRTSHAIIRAMLSALALRAEACQLSALYGLALNGWQINCPALVQPSLEAYIAGDWPVPRPPELAKLAGSVVAGSFN